MKHTATGSKLISTQVEHLKEKCIVVFGKLHYGKLAGDIGMDGQFVENQFSLWKC